MEHPIKTNTLKIPKEVTEDRFGEVELRLLPCDDNETLLFSAADNNSTDLAGLSGKEEAIIDWDETKWFSCLNPAS